MITSKLEFPRTFNMIRIADKALYGLVNADSLKEAQDKVWEMCQKTHQNYEDFYLEEREVSKYIQKFIAKNPSGLNVDRPQSEVDIVRQQDINKIVQEISKDKVHD